MRIADPEALRDPLRLAAVDRARRLLPALPMPLTAIARTAARLLHAPMGLLTLVGDGEEHLAGTYGLPEALTAGDRMAETYSVCKYMVAADAPVGCPDMSGEVDARVRDHPLAQEYGIRAFLGVPVRDADDRPVGSLTVLDDRPHAWTDEDVTALLEVVALVDRLPTTPPVGTVVLAELDSREVLEAISEAFLTLDAEARITGWNTAAQDMFGFTAAEACGQPVDELLRARYDGRPVRQVLADLLQRPDRIAGTVEVQHRDDRPLQAQVRLSVLHSPEGAIVCAFLTDITAQLAAAEAAHAAAAAADLDARTQRGFADILLDSMDEGVVAVDRAGRAVVYNRALRDMHGHPPELPPAEAHLASLSQLRHLDGTPIDPHETSLARALHGHPEHTLEALIHQPGRPDRFITATARPIIGRAGRPMGAVATVRETTERRRAEQFRDCQLAVARVLAGPGSLATLGAAALGLVGRALGWSYLSLRLVEPATDALRRVAIWHPDDAALGDLVPDRLPRSAHEIAARVWATGKPVWEPDLQTSRWMSDPAGRARARAYAQRGLRAAVSVPVLDGAEVLGVLTCFAARLHHDEFQTTGLLQDLATQAGHFLARRRAEELAAELRRARADFTALIGHDMRTPLTTIATYNQLRLDDPAPRPDADQQLLDGIDRNVTVLRELVDGLLDITALECDDDPLPSYEVDLTALLTGALDDSECGHDVAAAIEAGVLISGDPDRLRQLAAKLLTITTAAPLTDPAEPQVVLRQTAEMAELVLLSGRRIALRHDGFSPANTTGTGDTDTRIGVGLVLARIVAERHGGTFEITDRADGSAVTVRLPALVRAAAPDRQR
ncbi:GAF domain-containing protein [Cryptosporangium sp. NPDC048952]|uniref:GAF domain-containing protein n=1 Tax=Cryptosporangium sp. NPDC048952 TaxID=3363961 RepID=UPI003710787E